MQCPAATDILASLCCASFLGCASYPGAQQIGSALLARRVAMLILIVPAALLTAAYADLCRRIRL
jgi:hypothetical protein